MKNMRCDKKNKKGSILIFSLIIMSIMLISALGITLATVSEQKGASATEKSVQAFQIADTGVEMFFWKKKNATPTTKIKHINGNAETNYEIDPNNDYIVFKDILSDGKIKMIFYKSDGAGGFDIMQASGLSDANIVAVTKIKSVGIFGGVSRAIEIEIP